MRFQVRWIAAAEQDLASIWMQASDRAAITSAALEIDRRLASDPHLVGESREGTLRTTFELPLGVTFEVVDADRTVYVLAVWCIRNS